MLHADIGEMKHVVGVSDMQDDEIVVKAAEMQKLGAKTSHWAQKRRHGKTIRGFVQHESHVNFDGKISFSSRQMQDELQDVISKTKCFNCSEVGGGAGDSSCREGIAKAREQANKDQVAFPSEQDRWCGLSRHCA